MEQPNHRPERETVEINTIIPCLTHPREDVNPAIQTIQKYFDQFGKPVVDDRDIETTINELTRACKSRIQINWQNSDGSTLLHAAVASAKPNVVKLLLALNANPFIRDMTGKVAYATSVVYSIDTVFGKFVSNNADAIVDTPTVHSFLRSTMFQRLDQPVYYLPADNDGTIWDAQARIKARDRIKNKRAMLVEMKGNVDLHFTELLIAKICYFMTHHSETNIRVLDFLSRTFLQQSASVPRLKSREPSYNDLLHLGRIHTWAEKDSSRRDPQQSHEKISVDAQSLSDSYDEHPLDINDAPPEPLETEIQPDINKESPELLETKIQSDIKKEPPKPPETEIQTPDIISIVLPYFHSISSANLTKRRRSWTDNPDSTSKVDTNEHEPRTLDESYFASLNYKRLSQRNGLQVISGLTGAKEDEKLVLVIPQLWLFKLGSFIITALAADLRGLNPVEQLKSEIDSANLDVGTTTTSLQLTALILSECINFLDRPRSAGLQEPVFFTFEKAVAEILDKVQQYTKMVNLKKNTLAQEIGFTLDINRVRDELAIIEDVLDQQAEVWNKFYERVKDAFGKWKTSDPNLYSVVVRPLEQIPKYKRRVEKINKDTERVKDLISSLLGIKTNHASLKESHNSTILNIIVISFAIVTVIFTPLSFIASLLALPIEQFHPRPANATNSTTQSNSTDSDEYTSGFVARWMGLGELVSLTLSAVLVSLSLTFVNMRGERLLKGQQEAQGEMLLKGQQEAQEDSPEIKHQRIKLREMTQDWHINRLRNADTSGSKDEEDQHGTY